MRKRMVIAAAAIGAIAVSGSNAVAATPGDTITGNGYTWTHDQLETNSLDNSINGVTCLSASFCVAVGNTGKAWDSTNPTGGVSAWHVAVADQQPLTKVSCPSVSLCVAADTHGSVATTTAPLSAGPWTVTNIDGTTTIWDISCPTASLCVAVDDAGDALSTSAPTGGPSAWHMLNLDGTTGIGTISCTAAPECVAGDNAGNIWISTDPLSGAWMHFHVDQGTDFIQSISCPSSSLCVAVDGGGDALWSTAPAAGSAAWHEVRIDAGSQLTGVSCPSASFCAAVDRGLGNVLATNQPTNPSSWTSISSSTGVGGMYDVSCVDATLCVGATGWGGLNVATPASNPRRGGTPGSGGGNGRGPGKCVVPHLNGVTLHAAQQTLTKRHCRLGKVTSRRARRRLRGVVIAMNRKPGQRLPRGARVSVVLGR